VATIDGRPVYEDEILAKIQSQLMPLQTQEYRLKKQALENLVNEKLLEVEASKKGVPSEKLLQQEVDAKVSEPTDTEVNAVYLSQRDQLNRPLDDVRPQLQQSLKKAKIDQARQQYFTHLRDQAKVQIFLQQPRIHVSYDVARLRGNPKATVMIVEFSDFQCPFCREAEAMLANLLAKYDGQIALAYRDLPLQQIHPQAELAAEAARCATEQGKFWEYHDLLFANQDKLQRDGLLAQARALKLDEKQFDSCFTSGKYIAQIQQDYQDGIHAGANGTPTFFVNGIFINGVLPPSAFEQIIQEQLSQKNYSIP
jgi:protein-disulfide isomerase